MTYINQRPAFSLLTAISVMVIMGLLSTFIFSISSSTSKETYGQYQKEQAALLAQSYTEAAILRVLQIDRETTNCLENFSGDITTLTQNDVASAASVIANNGQGYHIDVDIHYIANNDSNITATPATCGTKLNVTAANADIDYVSSFNAPSTPSVSIIIDVFVQYKDPLAPNVAASPWITFHRRTLQKL